MGLEKTSRVAWGPRSRQLLTLFTMARRVRGLQLGTSEMRPKYLIMMKGLGLSKRMLMMALCGENERLFWIVSQRRARNHINMVEEDRTGGVEMRCLSPKKIRKKLDELSSETLL